MAMSVTSKEPLGFRDLSPAECNELAMWYCMWEQAGSPVGGSYEDFWAWMNDRKLAFTRAACAYDDLLFTRFQAEELQALLDHDHED